MRNVTVNARKYDGLIRKTWTGELVEEAGNLVMLLGIFGEDIEHAGLGSIRRGTLSYEYYWLDRPYNIFRFHEPDGTFRSFYCNVSLPATFETGVLDYVDLDIDIVVDRDLSYKVVDRDDFEVNSKKYAYTTKVKALAENAVTDLIAVIEKRGFPFNDTADVSARRPS
ncbi:MAG: DUF402 domain-containing protein [Pyrinomonadaceae bacterium]